MRYPAQCGIVSLRKGARARRNGAPNIMTTTAFLAAYNRFEDNALRQRIVSEALLADIIEMAGCGGYDLSALPAQNLDDALAVVRSELLNDPANDVEAHLLAAEAALIAAGAE